MGKATIYEHLGAGKYRILYTPEVAASDARIAELETLKTSLDAQLYSTNGLVEAKAAAQIAYDNSSNAFFSALDDWAACASQLPACAEQKTLIAEVGKRGAARSEAGVALNTIKMAIADNRSKYFSTTQEIAYLQNTKHAVAAVMEAWCIDRDDGNIIPVNTVVGTVETYGAKGGYAGGYLPRKWVNIQSSATPAYSATRDHCVKPLSGIKTAALFFNWAEWLYVMANNPQHAVGTVLSKGSPTQTYLDVELFGTTPGASQPGGYPFNGQNSVILLNVPVNYLSCGAELFTAGDHVIVRFTSPNRVSPTVIGFAESPKECDSCGTHGWEWHGLATAGTIALDGGGTKVMDNAPSHGSQWLVKSDQSISGGVFAGEPLSSSFIYVDSENKCWNIALNYSYQSTNTLLISANIIKQSLLGETPTASTSVSVSCTEIGIGAHDAGVYYGRQTELEDVWTDGHKAIIVVRLTSGFISDVFSVVEILLAGDGGDDGAGISISATEVMSQPDLTTGYTYTAPGSESPTCGGINWIASPTSQIYLPIEETFERIWARCAFYDATGSVNILRLKYNNSTSAPYCIDGWAGEVEQVNACFIFDQESQNYIYFDSIYQHAIAATDYTKGFYILINDVEIDRVESVETTSIHQRYSMCNGNLWSAPIKINDQTPSNHWFGSLSSELMDAGVFTNENTNGIVSAWRSGSETSIGYWLTSGGKYVGIAGINSKSAAFFIKQTLSGPLTYGSIATPLGTKTTSETSQVYFAWNRRTDAYTFSTQLVCYV